MLENHSPSPHRRNRLAHTHTPCGVWLPRGRGEEDTEASMLSSPKLPAMRVIPPQGRGNWRGGERPGFYTLRDISPHKRKHQECEMCFWEHKSPQCILVLQNELNFTIMKCITSNRTLHPYPECWNRPYNSSPWWIHLSFVLEWLEMRHDMSGFPFPLLNLLMHLISRDGWIISRGGRGEVCTHL